jgi:hypothetical protein
MNKPARKTTWIEVGVKNAGLRKGMTGLTWALCWAIARESLGEDPSVEEVANWWKDSYRTAYRNQAAFRKAFPGLETPAPIFESAEAQASIKAMSSRANQGDEKRNAKRSAKDLDIVKLGLLPASL